MRKKSRISLGKVLPRKIEWEDLPVGSARVQKARINEEEKNTELTNIAKHFVTWHTETVRVKKEETWERTLRELRDISKRQMKLLEKISSLLRETLSYIEKGIVPSKIVQKKEYLRKISEMEQKGIKDPFAQVFENKLVLTKEELLEAQKEIEE